MVGKACLASIAITSLHFSCAILPPDDQLGACDATGSCPERKALLQRSSQTHMDKSGRLGREGVLHRLRTACPLDISSSMDAQGKTAALTEPGFRAVKKLCCPTQMREFIRRLVQSQSNVVCNEGGLNGLALWYYCDGGRQAANHFQKLLSEVGPGSSAQSGDCPWVGFGANKDLCSPLDSTKCASYPGVTNPPCTGCIHTKITMIAKSRTTTTARGVTTTLIKPALLGSNVLEVKDTEGFLAGQHVIIAFGTSDAETNVIEALSPMLLRYPLQKNHIVHTNVSLDLGTTTTKMGIHTTATTSTSKTAAPTSRASSTSTIVVTTMTTTTTTTATAATTTTTAASSTATITKSITASITTMKEPTVVTTTNYTTDNTNCTNGTNCTNNTNNNITNTTSGWWSSVGELLSDIFR